MEMVGNSFGSFARAYKSSLNIEIMTSPKNNFEDALCMVEQISSDQI